MPGFENERLRRQREDQEQERLDQMHASQNARCCPHCGRIIEKNAGCDVMTCGNHAHQRLQHGEGCGREFNWSQARPYRPTLSEARQPAGYSAILAWLTSETFAPSAQTAEAALAGLCLEDRRYAFANAAACGLLKRGQSQPVLAEALRSDAALQQALGFQDPRLAHVAAVLCDTSALRSSSLAAAVLVGRDGWDGAAGGAGAEQNYKLRNALVNLLVAVLGSPDNNHLTMLLLEPLAMLNTFPVGFCFGALPGPEGYHFDCGCVLDAAGCAGRNRPPLENRHLHFVNFCSWAMLSIGLLVFPENCQHIDQVLTMRYMGEVEPSGRNVPENARTYSMNFALRCFECICAQQGLSEDDRGLCFSQLSHRFRAEVSDAGFQAARTFATAEQRQLYEGTWGRLVDEVLGSVGELHQEALRTSQAQEQLMQLHDFRVRRSFLHFRFEACKLVLPAAPELSFVTALITRQEELSHLPLLAQIVVVQNWIFDRLNRALPESCLDQPVLQLMKKRLAKDKAIGSVSDARHCEIAISSFQRFVQGWKKFYAENDGQIPIECQAARARAGLEAQQTRLEAIEDDQKIPLRFFLNGDAECQPQMVAKHLCTTWNELVDSAVASLEGQGDGSAVWAGRMKREVPVWLADLFFQEQLVETLQSETLERSVLRQLRGAQGQMPRVEWPAVQQEILSSAWVHRVQRLNFPEASAFLPRREGGQEQPEALDKEMEEQIMESLAQMPLPDLQGCREVVARVALQLGDANQSTLVLEQEEIRSQQEAWPPQAVQLLRGIKVGALRRLGQILDEENGEFSRFSSVLAVRPSPELAQVLTAVLAFGPPGSQAKLAERDAQLRETMTNLEDDNFCNFLMRRDGLPLRSSYETVHGEESLLSELPDDVLGCNLVAVLQQLRLLMREVRAQKSVLDQATVWDPRQGLQRLLEEEHAEPEDWWEGPELEMNSVIETQLEVPKELILSLVCWACASERGVAPEGSKELLRQCGFASGTREADRCVEKLLCMYEDQMKELRKEGSTGWQRSLSRIKLQPLDSLLHYKECSVEGLGRELWRIACSKLRGPDAADGAQATCVLPDAWQRFVAGPFSGWASAELEEAIRAVGGFPEIVEVPPEAEERTVQGQEVLLSFQGRYYQLLLDVEPEPAKAQTALHTAAHSMQKAWRAHSARRQATQKKAAEEAARSLKEDSQEEAAEKPVHAVNEGSQEEAAEKPVHAVKEDSREEAAEKPVLAVKQDSQEEAVEKPVPAVKEAWSEQATSQQLIAMKVQSEVSSEWDLESLASWQVVPEARRCWLERFVASAHDLQPSLYGAFILPDSEEGQEQKCAECFEQLMKLHLQDKRKNWGAVARKECGNYAKSIMKAHGKAKPFGLELDELFALVAYAYDHPPAPPSANFWALLGSLVRERQLQEAGLFLRYFKQAVEKRMQRQPEATFLYCAMPEMNLTLEEGMYVRALRPGPFA
ncbi:unnamed protein product [Effrenium voratum]|nr:unnamed protein product [Effrenium voratum]